MPLDHVLYDVEPRGESVTPTPGGATEGHARKEPGAVLCCRSPADRWVVALCWTCPARLPRPRLAARAVAAQPCPVPCRPVTGESGTNSPARCARTAARVRDGTASLTRMCSRCAATVRGAMTRARAIAAFEYPSITSPRTSSSRGVSPAGPPVVTPAPARSDGAAGLREEP